MTKAEAVKRLETIIENSNTYDYCEFDIVAKDWQNYGKDRTYLSIVERSKNYSISKHYKSRDYGYYDNTAGQYVAGKNDLTKDYTFGGMNF